MAEQNVQIKRYNGSSWDLIYPKTKAGNVSGLKAVATSGSYADLSNTPAILGRFGVNDGKYYIGYNDSLTAQKMQAVYTENLRANNIYYGDTNGSGGTSLSTTLAGISTNATNIGVLQNKYDANGKLKLAHIPDAILGQLVYAGLIYYDSTSSKVKATLSSNAQSILTQKNVSGVSSGTLTFPASTNTSDIAELASNCEGCFFLVSETTNLADLQSALGLTSPLATGDWIVSYKSGSSLDSGVWAKVDNTDAVTSVNGRIGAIETYKGTWSNSSFAYKKGDIVSYTNGGATNFYICTENVTSSSSYVPGSDGSKFSRLSLTNLTAAQNGTSLSAVTTGEKYTWNNKQASHTNLTKLTEVTLADGLLKYSTASGAFQFVSDSDTWRPIKYDGTAMNDNYTLNLASVADNSLLNVSSSGTTTTIEFYPIFKLANSAPSNKQTGTIWFDTSTS